jgi:hypothetical protein
LARTVGTRRVWNGPAVAATGGARLVELQLARQLGRHAGPFTLRLPRPCSGRVRAEKERESSPSTSSPTPRASARIGAGWNQRPLPGRTQSLQTRLFRIRRRIDLRLFGRHRGLREAAPAGYLRGFPCGMRAGSAEAGGRLRPDRQQKMLICREFTGATGLEPATSGVTGRRSRGDHRALRIDPRLQAFCKRTASAQM